MTQVEDKNYYELLGVEQSATTDQIKEAYRELARIFHPDSRFYDEITGNKTNIIVEDRAFKLVTEAYNTLTSIERRRNYDSKLPKGLKGWDSNSDLNLSAKYKNGPPSGALGVFGVIRDQPTSEFDKIGAETPEQQQEINNNLRSAVVKLSRWQRFLLRIGIKPTIE